MKQSFKLNKFNTGIVTKGFGSRVEEIANATKPALLDLTVQPEFDDAGRPIGWFPTQKIIKTNVKRVYNIFGKEFEIFGTLYKLEKGGRDDSYFQPNMSSLKDMFESAVSLNELYADMMYWLMQPRTISDVAQGATSDPNLQMFIGKPYLEGLINDDELQFSRVSFIQALNGEKLIYGELLKMLASGGNNSSGIIPESADGSAMISTSAVIKTLVEPQNNPRYNGTLAPLGGRAPINRGLNFGSNLGKSAAEAGRTTLNKTSNLSIKK